VIIFDAGDPVVGIAGNGACEMIGIDRFNLASVAVEDIPGVLSFGGDQFG